MVDNQVGSIIGILIVVAIFAALGVVCIVWADKIAEYSAHRRVEQPKNLFDKLANEFATSFGRKTHIFWVRFSGLLSFVAAALFMGMLLSMAF